MWDGMVGIWIGKVEVLLIVVVCCIAICYHIQLE